MPFAKATDAGCGFFEHIHRGAKDQSNDMVDSETRSRQHKHILFLQQLLGKVHVAAEIQYIRVNTCHGIHGTTRRQNLQARSLHQFAAQVRCLVLQRLPQLSLPFFNLTIVGVEERRNGSLC